MVLPYLPREVFDEIIGQLADETSTLKSCSLVCRSFRRSAQKILFNSTVVELNSNSDKSDNLVLIVDKAPHLIEYIQKLQIFVDFIDHPLKNLHDDNYTPMLVNALGIFSRKEESFPINLRSLWLDDLPWGFIPPLLEDALVLLMTVHSLRDIVLESGFDYPANLVQNLPPLLKHLSLLRTEFSSLPRSLPTNRDELPKLESLTIEIRGDSFPSGLVERIVDISQLKTFQGSTCNPSTMSVIERILGSTSNSLEHLTLELYINNPDSVFIDLNRFSHLTDITIYCYADSSIFPLIPAKLSLITKRMKSEISCQNVIQNLSFHLESFPDLDMVDFVSAMKDVWQELDTICSIPQLASSKSFRGITFGMRSTAFNYDAFSDLVQSKLPVTKKASKLHIKTYPSVTMDE
ncbi:hypothetical protein JOM56_000491 [Amanita muscaria]